MAQKSIESIRNQQETTGHNTHVPRRRQSFVAAARDGGRIFKKSHFRPRHKRRHKRHLNCHC
eukprot:scaffold960_cov203-Skeletonema_dohrnii-CCMP3373.AAC.2